MSSYIEAIGQANTAASAGLKNEDTSKTSMGKDDFLTLLVAQLENQDPLNPDDATEFTAQLAQFSSLEQLFSLNESMENLVAASTGSDKFSTLNTIGKEVTYHSGTFDFTGTPMEIGYKLDNSASQVTLTLQHNGSTISTLNGTELEAGNHLLSWDGMTENGTNAPTGKYEIVVSAKAADGESVAVAPIIKSAVTGVDLEGETGGMLITEAGDINYSEILGVYNPGTRVETNQNNKNTANAKEALATANSLTKNIKDIIN